MLKIEPAFCTYIEYWQKIFHSSNIVAKCMGFHPLLALPLFVYTRLLRLAIMMLACRWSVLEEQTGAKWRI